MKAPAFALAVCAVFTLAASGPPYAGQPAPSPSAQALFSRGALRRARLVIQLRMLELREERLQCVRAALLHRLPPDLLPPRVKQTSGPNDTAFANPLHESEDCR